MCDGIINLFHLCASPTNSSFRTIDNQWLCSTRAWRLDERPRGSCFSGGAGNSCMGIVAQSGSRQAASPGPRFACISGDRGAVFCFGLFSLSSFKLDYYLLPAMPAAALIIGPIVAGADEHSRLARRMIQTFVVLCSLVVVVIAFLVLKAAVILSNQSFFRFMPLVIAVGGAAVISLHLKRRKLWRAAMILIVVMWATILTTQLALLPAFTRYLPATQLAARVPSDRIWYTSWAASDWANCIAFNLAPPHHVERLVGDAGNERLVAALKNDSRAVVVIWEREYAELATKDPELRVLAQAETYGRGGLNLKMVRQPRRERLMLVGH